MKWYGKYGGKTSWIVIRYGKYERNPSRIMKRYDKCRRKVVEMWNDMENMDERQVE